jgi:hypothetical protein
MQLSLLRTTSTTHPALSLMTSTPPSQLLPSPLSLCGTPQFLRSRRLRIFTTRLPFPRPRTRSTLQSRPPTTTLTLLSLLRTTTPTLLTSLPLRRSTLPSRLPLPALSRRLSTLTHLPSPRTTILLSLLRRQRLIPSLPSLRAHRLTTPCHLSLRARRLTTLSHRNRRLTTPYPRNRLDTSQSHLLSQQRAISTILPRLLRRLAALLAPRAARSTTLTLLHQRPRTTSTTPLLPTRQPTTPSRRNRRLTTLCPRNRLATFPFLLLSQQRRTPCLRSQSTLLHHLSPQRHLAPSRPAACTTHQFPLR